MSILIAYNLLKYRKENNLTQQQLSDRLEDITKSAISSYEKNKRTPSKNVQDKICKELNISSDILKGQNELRILQSKIRKELTQLQINHNDYLYVYDFIKHFFSFNNLLGLQKGSAMLQYSFNDVAKEFCTLNNKIYDYSTNIYGKDTISTQKLIKYINITFNLFFEFIFSLIVEIDTDFIIPVELNNYDIITIKKWDRKFIEATMELKSYFIKIFENLTSILTSEEFAIPMYYKDMTNIIDYIKVSSNNKKQTSILLAIKVEDDYMFPRYDKDDILILKEDKEDYKTGDYIAVINNNKSIHIGKLILNNDLIILQPLNNSYIPKIFNLQDCKIIGKVIENKYHN